MKSDDTAGPRPVAEPISNSNALTSVHPGGRIGRYTLGRLLGRGAMAAVWEAHDTQLGRDVAIKVLSPAFSQSAQLNERFRREARAVAAIDHPGIVRVHDFVAEDESHPGYLVEELIHGETLGALLKAHGKVLPEVAAAIAAAVAGALAAAHARGVIHRDVKPDNIMLEPMVRGSARVVLTDFGVAHVAGLESMTITGGLVGSPAYMSPEQARGRLAGPPTDQWALGVVLYQLATGHLPFRGRDPLTMLAAIAKGGFERPTRIQPRLGPELEAIILRALRSEPRERYPGIADMAAALDDVLRVVGVSVSGGAGGELLRAYLDDPADVEARMGPLVAEQACTRARRHLARRNLAPGLAEIGRAQAYVPGHPGAARLLASIGIGQRRRVRRVLAAAVGLSLLALAGTWRLARGPRGAGQAAAPPGSTEGAKVLGLADRPRREPVALPGAARVEAAGEGNPGAASWQGAARPVTATSSTGTMIATHRARRGRAVPECNRGASKPGGMDRRPDGYEIAGTCTKLESEDVPAPATTSTATSGGVSSVLDEKTRFRPAPSSATGGSTVELSASHGMCFPTLDDADVGSLAPEYANVPPGMHRVFCSRTAQGPRLLVGALAVPTGGTIRRVILIDPLTGEARFSDALPARQPR